jgi:hypothetical protein
MIVPYQLRKMIEEVIRVYVPSSRALGTLGASIAAANNLTLGLDGNAFTITGATQINLLDSTAWKTGSSVVLILNGGATVKHNQVASGVFLPLFLSGGTDFVTTNPATLSLMLTSTFWVETGRKA